MHLIDVVSWGTTCAHGERVSMGTGWARMSMRGRGRGCAQAQVHVRACTWLGAPEHVHLHIHQGVKENFCDYSYWGCRSCFCKCMWCSN